MTDIGVYTHSYQAEKLDWDLGHPHQGFEGSGTLSVAAFTQAQHFANGYLPSGTILGKLTSGGLLAPYLDANSDGSNVAVGILKASVKMVNDDGTLKVKVGCAFWVAFRPISVAKLPFTSGTAAAGGYVDADAKTDLPLIYWGA